MYLIYKRTRAMPVTPIIILGLLLFMAGVGNTADREQRYSLPQAVRAALQPGGNT